MDYGQKATDKLLRKVEARINGEFATAMTEIETELNNYLHRFEKKDEKWRSWVKSGEKTREEYNRWRIGQMAVGKRWNDEKTLIATQLYKTNEAAKGIIRKYMPEMYAENYNFATYQVEKDAHIDTMFTLYSRESVIRLAKDNPEVLPPVGKKTAKAIAEGKAIRWNKQQLQSAMTQGILQGDSIPKLASRIARTVGDRDRKAAIRNARTAATGAQNAGRVGAYKRAQEKGVDLEQMWMATLDGRTRHSHRWLDGEVRPVGEEFSNGCEYPADPKGDPEEIYNCRCSLRGVVKGLDRKSGEFRSNEKIGDMTYDEWRNAKPVSGKITNPDTTMDKAKQGYINEYMGIGVNKNGKAIEYDLRTEAVQSHQTLINQLAAEYNTNLEKVTHGAEKAAGDVDIMGSVMRINSKKEENAIHEFAHTLANSRAEKYNLQSNPEFWKEIKKTQREYLRNVQSDTDRWISTYEHASKNVDEFFAEAFTHAKMREMGLPAAAKYGSDYTYSQKVLEITDKYFKKNLGISGGNNGIISNNSTGVDLQFFSEKLGNQKDTYLKKGIRSLSKEIEAHEKWIENPKLKWKDWDSFDERRKYYEIDHWKHEIKNFNDSIQNRIDELKRRGIDYER